MRLKVKSVDSSLNAEFIVAHPFLWWGRQATVPVQPLQSNDESSCTSGSTCFPSTHDLGVRSGLTPERYAVTRTLGWNDWNEMKERDGEARSSRVFIRLSDSCSRRFEREKTNSQIHLRLWQTLWWRALSGATSKQGVWTTLTSGHAFPILWCHVKWNSSCKTNVASFFFVMHLGLPTP